MEAGGGSQRWGKIHAQVLFDSILPWFPVLNLLSSPLLMMHDVALPASAFASALVGQRLPSLVLLWCPFCWLLQSTERQFVLCDALPGLRCRIGGVFVCVCVVAVCIVEAFFTKRIERIWSIHESEHGSEQRQRNESLCPSATVSGGVGLVTPRWNPTASSLAGFLPVLVRMAMGELRKHHETLKQHHETSWNTFKYHEIPWTPLRPSRVCFSRAFFGSGLRVVGVSSVQG